MKQTIVQRAHTNASHSEAVGKVASRMQGYFKALCGAMLVFCGFAAHAQMTVQIGNGTSTPGAVYGPMYQSGQNGNETRHIYLYTQDELANVGIFPGSTITSFGWFKANNAVLINNAIAKLEIFQRNGADVPTAYAYAGNVPVLSYIGSTFNQVATFNYDTSAAHNLPTAIDWASFPVTPFIYNGGNLEIYLHWVLSQGTGNVTTSTLAWKYGNTNGVNTDLRRTIYSTNAAPTSTTTFSSVGYRPNLQVTYKRTVDNASVSAIVEPTIFCQGTYNVKANIRNNGSTALNNVVINWSVDGVAQPSFTYSTIIDTFGSSTGNNAVVPLGSLTFATNVPRIVNVWTSQPNGRVDPINIDDTLSAYMRTGYAGTFTVGGTNPDFTNVTDAVDALNTYGICGPVTINIRSGVYNMQTSLKNVQGTSTVNTITFQSAAHNPDSVTLTFSASTGFEYIFDIYNVSNLTFKHLGFKSLNSIYPHCIQLGGNSSNVLIDSCKLVGPISGSNTSSSALFIASANSINGTDFSGTNLVFTNNLVRGGGVGISIEGAGSTTLLSGSIVIRNNVFDSVITNGALFNYVSDIKFNNNSITGYVASTTSVVQNAIAMQNCDNAIEVTGNKIFMKRTATAVGVRGIWIQTSDGSSAFPGIVANNIIVCDSAKEVYGIYLQNNSYLKTYNNSVLVRGGDSTTSFPLYFNAIGSGINYNEVRNNVFVNTAPSGGRAFFYNATAPENVLDYNNYYSAAKVFAQYNTSTSIRRFFSFTEWKAFRGLDKNSTNYLPVFLPGDDLKPDPADPSVWVLNGRGDFMPGNNVDLVGTPRSTSVKTGPVDVGAYEFKPTSTPPAALATPTAPVANTTQVFTIGEDTVATIAWGASVPTTATVRQYSGALPPANTLRDSMYFYTDIAMGTGSYTYTNNVYYKNTWLGSLFGETAIRMSQKNGTNPWTSYTGATSTVDTGRNIITAPNLTTAGLFSGVGEQCTGQPLLPVITTPGLANPQCPGDSYTLNASYGSESSGISYQWERATASGGPWTNVAGGSGATTLTYVTPNLTADVYYRIKVACINGGQTNTSATFGITMAPVAQVVSTTPASRCGTGTVKLGATGSSNANLYWYDAPVLGKLMDTGAVFTTPPLTATTTYYVSASNTTKDERATTPPPSIEGTVTTNNGLAFTTTKRVTINTVDVYMRSSSATAAARIRIDIRTQSTNTVIDTIPYTFTVTPTMTKHVIPLNVTLPPGTYKMSIATATSNISNIIRELGSYPFPYVSPSGAVSITSATSSSQNLNTSYNTVAFNYFYNWSITIPCESGRTPVTATLGAAPAFSVAATTPVICSDGVTQLKVTSTPGNYDTVSWAPLANLYTDAAGTTPYTGGNASVIYARTAAMGQKAVQAIAFNTLSECGNLDTARYYVQPAVARATANPTDICVSGTTTVRIDNPELYRNFQWQSSTNGTSYTDISSATNNSYTTPNLTSSMYYRMQIKNSTGAVCVQPSIKVNVTNTAITGVANGSHCGYGTVSLSANATSGSTLKWYSASTGGTELFTGNPFVTPVISANTTYYVAAVGGKRSGYIGKQDNTTVLTGNGTTTTDAGLAFDVSQPFTLDSVAIYPIGTGVGTLTIELSSGNTVYATATVNVVGTPAPGIKTIIPLNFSVPQGSGLNLKLKSRTGSVTGLARETLPTGAYPYVLPGVASITTSVGFFPTSGFYGYFYDWFVSVPCLSGRQAVVASITTPPSIALSATPATICAGDASTISATSSNSSYTYTWNPGAVTGASRSVSPQTTSKYYLTAIDNSAGPNAGCTNRDSITVNVNQLPTATITPSGSPTICEGDSVTLFANSGAGLTYKWQKGGTDISNATNSSYDAKTSGSYTVSVVDGNICHNVSAPFVVTVKPAPVPVITLNGNDLSTQTTFGSYQWYRDGQLISGATSATYTPTVSGVYTVSVTDGSGCSGISAPYNYNTTGIASANVMGQYVKIYPNPATAVVHIDAPAAVNVVITTLDGKMVLQQQDAKDIDILRLPAGVYMIKVLDSNNVPVNMERLVKVAQ